MADVASDSFPVPVPPRDPYGPVQPWQTATQGLNGEPNNLPLWPGNPLPGPMTPAGAPLDVAPQGPAAQPGTARTIFDDLLALDAAQRQAAGAGTGGLSSTTTTRTKQNDSPELARLRAEREQYEANMGERMRQTATAAEENGLAQSRALALRAEAVGQEAVGMQERQQAQTVELQKRQGEVDKASREYVKAAKDIDPNRFMSGGRGVLAAIAMAAGAYGATLGRTQNFAQQIIESAIDRDLQAQHMALNAKKDAMTMTQQAFQNYRAIYQDDAAARAAVRGLAYEAHAANLGSLAAKFSGKEQRANILNQRDQFMMQSNMYKQQAAEMAAGRIQTSTTTQSGGAVGGNASDVIGRLGQIADVAKKLEEQRGAGGPNKSDEAKLNEVSTIAGDYANVIKVGTQVQNLLQRTDGMLGGNLERGTGLTKDSKTLATAMRQLRLAIINASSGKAFTEAERVEIKEMLDEGAWTNTGMREKLEQVQAYMASKVQAQISTLHPQHREQLYTRMRGGGVANNVLESMFTGRAASGQGAAYGAGPVR